MLYLLLLPLGMVISHHIKFHMSEWTNHNPPWFNMGAWRMPHDTFSMRKLKQFRTFEGCRIIVCISCGIMESPCKQIGHQSDFVPIEIALLVCLISCIRLSIDTTFVGLGLEFESHLNWAFEFELGIQIWIWGKFFPYMESMWFYLRFVSIQLFPFLGLILVSGILYSRIYGSLGVFCLNLGDFKG